MAFANLFKRLSTVEDEFKSAVQPDSTCRSESDNGKRGNITKRKGQMEHKGPQKKKQCLQVLTRSHDANPADSNATLHSMYNSDGEYKGVSFSEKVTCNNNKGGNNNMYHKGQKCKPQNNCSEKMKAGGEKRQTKQKGRGSLACRGGGHQTTFMRKGRVDRKNNKQDLTVKHSRFMTQEFKDQNALMVGGRLLCRHFLRGRCIKGEDCQLEHVQGYNNLIKELCKFYVQGFCTKGSECLYMHKSFPCKFFHRIGKCSQGENCRFSHEPLDDITTQLLDEALKREKDLCELARKAEAELPGVAENTHASEMTEKNQTPDIFLQPLRPSFYSADTNIEKETMFCATVEQPDYIIKEAFLPCASDAARPHSPPPSNFNPAEPVCYSVEAVLGPQVSKPFTSSFTTPRCKEFTPLCSSEHNLYSVNQPQKVPYSVDAVLSSCKSVEKTTFGQTRTLSGQSPSFVPKRDAVEVSHPLLSPEEQNKKVLSSNLSYLPSFLVHTDPSSKTLSDLSPTSRDHQTKGDISETPKPALPASHEVKLDLLSTDMRCSVNSTAADPALGPMNSKGIFSKPPFHTSPSQLPMQVNPHLFRTPDSQVAFKPFCQSSGFAQSSLTEIQSGLKPGSKYRYSTESPAECSVKMPHCADLAAGCRKTETYFHNLFANPISDTLQSTDHSVKSSGPLVSNQPSCPGKISEDYRKNHQKTQKPNKPSASSFLSLFASPLTVAPSSLQSVQVEYKPRQPLHSEHGTNGETPLLKQDTAEDISNMPTSHNFSAHNKIGQCSSPERMTQHPDQPASSANGPFTRHCHKQLSDISLNRESATTSSVLETLFQHLGPYKQEGTQQHHIQISDLSECEMEKNTELCVFVNQRRKSTEEVQQLKKNADAPKKWSDNTVSPSRQQHSFVQTPQISMEATVWSTLSNTRSSENHIRDLDTRSFPSKAAVPLSVHHVQRGLLDTTEEGKTENPTVAAAALRDLFKILDTAVFNGERKH